MLRIRDRTGKTAEIQEQFRFVEICDNRGDIAKLLYTDDAGAVKVIGAGEPEALRYAQLFNVNFCPVIPIRGPE